MFNKRVLFLLAAASLAAVPARTAQAPPAFTAADRVLVVAPHPDDETLGLGGVLQRARAAGADVRVLYLTNGESNEVASIFYQKRPLLLRSDFLKSGATRKREALEAMGHLGGLVADNLVFFGYPDGGLLTMWLKHWGMTRPFRSIFTRLTHVPSKDNFSSGRPFKGDEVVRDMESVLLSFRPTTVFVTAPFDLNPDHQAAYLYLQVALRSLEGRLEVPPVSYVYLVHARDWPEPERFLPGHALNVPSHLGRSSKVDWKAVPLNDAEVQKKAETLLKYESQTTVKKNFLLSFARKNELLAEYPAEKLSGEAPAPGDVGYKVLDKELWIEIPLSASLDEMGVVTSYVFGYRRGHPFGQMPKFSFRLFGNKMFVHDGARSFHDPKLVYRFEKDRLFIRVPLRLLKDPDLLFVSTRSAKEEPSLDFGSWRTLELVI